MAHHLTFKQFLLEGGAATAAFHTTRATKDDIHLALQFVEKHAGIPYQQLKDNLLGSTGHTLAGIRETSGDIDIAVEDGRYGRQEVVQAMKDATGVKDVKAIGGNTYSFPVPTKGDKKVQVDLMFVPSEKWARFGYHSAANSKHKGAIRNFLFDSLLKRVFEKDKDLSVTEDGQEIARARRFFKRGEGLTRLFKLAPLRKDKKGRVALRKATPEEVAAELKRIGRTDKFSQDPDPILDPDKAAEFMFGKGVKAKDVLSAEQVIKLIEKRPDHVEIFKDAITTIEKEGLTVPEELEKYR